MRLLVLVLLVVLAVWLLRRALRRARQGPEVQPRSSLEAELVPCAHCGVNLPRAEARAAGGRLYCGEEHARLGPER